MSQTSRIFAPTQGVDDWKELLAHPDKHWKQGRSAFELATAWESASGTERGLPPEVAAALDGHSDLAGASLLLGIPEHQVPLDGGGHASQSDLWALLHKAPVGLVSVAVEAKAGEGFGQTVDEWLAGAPPNSGKPARLAQLKSLLGLPADCHSLKYQLFHRLGSAIIEAKRFGAPAAMLLVQSFSSDAESHRAYAAFCDILGADPGAGHVAKARRASDLDMYLGWVGGH